MHIISKEHRQQTTFPLPHIDTSIRKLFKQMLAITKITLLAFLPAMFPISTDILRQVWMGVTKLTGNTRVDLRQGNNACFSVYNPITSYAPAAHAAS